MTGSNLRHSHINIKYWKWLEYIFISPAQHQLHHSIAQEHYDKNFGAALAIWDWLFGSLHLSEEEKATFKIEKGVVISKMLNSRLYNYGIEEGFVVLEVNDILIDEVATIESITLESLSSILFLSPDGQKERILFE